MIVWGALRVRRPGEELGARRARPAAHHDRRTSSGASSDFRAGVYMQTLLRDPAAGLMHSLIYFGFLVLLAVTTVLEIDHQLPEELKFLHGRTYQALRVRRRRSPALVFLVGVVWAIVRRYVQRPVPHPHQDQARARRHPRHVLRHRRHRLPRRGVPHRRQSASRASRSGASSATRCRQLVDGLVARRRCRHVAPVDVDRPRRRRSSCSSRSCRSRCCATCSRRR